MILLDQNKIPSLRPPSPSLAIYTRVSKNRRVAFLYYCRAELERRNNSPFSSRKTRKKDDEQEAQKPDLEKLQQEKLIRYLKANREEGLSSEEAAQRLKIYGPNVFEMPKEEDMKRRSWINKVCICLKWDPIIPEHKNMMRLMLNPISWAMVFAAIVTASLYAIGGNRLYLYDSLAITSLLLLNYASCYVAMIRVRNGKAPLIGALKPKSKVLRDGSWREEDIIFLRWGDVVPADVYIVDDREIETTLGRLLKDVEGSIVYDQDSLRSGEGVAVVIATGRNITTAGNFCFWAVIIGTMIELAVTSVRKPGCRSILHDHLILLIGGLPMAMPAVFYLCMSCGSRKLCQLGVASRGTVGLEDLAAIDTVFFNKTGTLRLNEPKFDRSKIRIIR
ncbi:hypothetical protein LUZ60_014396 [Juncus effusus]|nr:hypothetical protein LUZ60_014396 [Juncus effusus]